MSKFKVGDRVRGKNGEILTIESFYGMPEYDRHNFGAAEKGFLATNSDWKYLNDFDLVSPQQPLTNTIITDITSPEQHKRVQEKLFEMGNGWYKNNSMGDGAGDKNWNVLRTNYFCKDTIWIDGVGDLRDTSTDNYIGLKSIPASEFLGEEEVPKIKIMPSCSSLPDFKEINKLREMPIIEFNKEYINNPSTSPCEGKGTKIMENIVSFFNDLTVSQEDKELRKAGLLDEDLEVTNSAWEVIKNLEAKERGYKNWEDLTDKIFDQENSLSPLEAETLYKKFSAKLLETAKKFNRKDEKKSK